MVSSRAASRRESSPATSVIPFFSTVSSPLSIQPSLPIAIPSDAPIPWSSFIPNNHLKPLPTIFLNHTKSYWSYFITICTHIEDIKDITGTPGRNSENKQAVPQAFVLWIFPARRAGAPQ